MRIEVIGWGSLVWDPRDLEIEDDRHIDGQGKLYLVVETKGTNWWDDLRHKEGAKIKCSEKYFAVLAEDDKPAKFIKSTCVYDMMSYT